MTGTPFIRCAIYTRKSSEEGLDQSFNSLHAQREACEAYVKSQKHEAWQVMDTHYDDGGFSGESMDRPALQKLLGDITAGKVNVVVVYKVDRLTRSLLDFSRIIESFDGKGVSFVSITQQFNTTTSMGRLTLNILLSFAQFEREVTGERIRDKVAASKKKGMWMGGRIPLGYDLEGRHLLINLDEAKVVRELFLQYLKFGCVSELQRYLEQRGIVGKVRSSASGKTTGGSPFSRGALYHLLKNRIYVGEISHKGNIYHGIHERIIDRETWDKVQSLLAQNNQGKRQRGVAVAGSLLAGILFDSAGNRYTPTHSVKRGKRYRYYTSQAAIHRRETPHAVQRIPAHEIERFVQARLKSALGSPAELSSALGEAGLPARARQQILGAVTKITSTRMATDFYATCKNMLHRVVIEDDRIVIELSIDAMSSSFFGCPLAETTTSPLNPKKNRVVVAKLNCQYRAWQWSNENRLTAPNDGDNREDPDPTVQAIARARYWSEQIVKGDVHNLEQLAARYGCSSEYVSRIFHLSSASPHLVEAALKGGVASSKAAPLIGSKLALDWSKQTF